MATLQAAARAEANTAAALGQRRRPNHSRAHAAGEIRRLLCCASLAMRPLSSPAGAEK